MMMSVQIIYTWTEVQRLYIRRDDSLCKTGDFQIMVYDFQIMEHGQQIMEYDFQIMEHGLQIMEYDFQIMEHGLHIMEYDF